MADQETKRVVAAHALILQPDQRFLVTRRALGDDYKPGEYDLPGGTVKLGEKTKAALQREVREETGLEVAIYQPIHVFDYMSGPHRHQFQITFKCGYKGGDVRLNASDHDDFFWGRPEDLISLPLIAFLNSLLNEVLLADKQNGVGDVPAGADFVTSKPQGR
ncbi:NUDIX hydrolase [Candidatus Microgenomates bacterium]|nr:NUDIX hydrolase [Candidatus Microgenomates bacterium]